MRSADPAQTPKEQEAGDAEDGGGGVADAGGQDERKAEDPARDGVNWFAYGLSRPTRMFDFNGRQADDSFDPVYYFDWERSWR